MSTIIRCDCGKEAYAWRVTRWGRDAVCRDCNRGYPHEGSFEPFVPWSTQNSADSGAGANNTQQANHEICPSCLGTGEEEADYVHQTRSCSTCKGSGKLRHTSVGYKGRRM